MDHATLTILLQKHFAGNLTEREYADLQRWFKEVGAHEFDKLVNELQAQYPNEYTQVYNINDAFAQRLEARVDAIEAEENEEPLVTIAPVHRIHVLKTAWFRYAAAVIIIFGIGAYLWNTQKEKENPSLAQTNQSVPVKNDVAPGGNKAILTLADGSTIVLEDANNGEIAVEHGAAISKEQNKIIYKNSPSSGGGGETTYNTMTTPRGGQYQLTLADGTKVWLNAESSITYPTRFSEKQRKVAITGEAYFEVAKDKAKPFIVSVYPKNSFLEKPLPEDGDGYTIEVLGTHFNVNAYPDESSANTTLLEGSVKIASGNAKMILKPGQQAQLNKQTNKLSLAINPDVEQVMAWRNGLFNFNNATLEQVLRQLARWYDVEVVYNGKVQPKKFGGKIQRDLNLSEVLDVLKDAGVKFTINNKIVTVRPS
jgi:ferric-dicitrate binding protein FerR (iron transport regulator)